MNAAITSVYSVIAVCTPWIDVSRSSTIWEIATFMTLESSTMMNWAEAKISMGSHLRTAASPSPLPKRAAMRRPTCRLESLAYKRGQRMRAQKAKILD